jgi:Protein of unknown function (DUF3467)
MSENQESRQPSERRMDITIADQLEQGVFADFANIWHTQDVFVLDFATFRQPPYIQEDPETGQQVGVLPGRVVARVRIPPSQVFEFMKALEQQLSAWEKETGQKL